MKMNDHIDFLVNKRRMLWITKINGIVHVIFEIHG